MTRNKKRLVQGKEYSCQINLPDLTQLLKTTNENGPKEEILIAPHLMWLTHIAAE